MELREPLKLSQFAAHLRRLWFVPLALAVVGGIGFRFAGGAIDRVYEQRVDLRSTRDAEFATELGAPSLVDPMVPSALAQRLNSELDERQDELPPGEDLRAVGSDQTQVLSIFATATSPERALTLAMATATDLVTDRRAAFRVRVDRSSVFYEGELERVEARLAEVPADNSVERSLLLIDRLTTVRSLSALEAVADVSEGGVSDPQPIGVATRASKSAAGTYAILGAILGLVLGAFVVILHRAASNKIFDAADVSRSGVSAPVLAEVPAGSDARAGVFAAVAAAATRHVATGRGDGVLVASIDADGAALPVARQLAAVMPQLGLVARLRETGLPDPGGHGAVVAVDAAAFDDSVEGPALAASLGAVVLVARRRRTRASRVLSAAEQFERVGGDVRGVVLVG